MGIVKKVFNVKEKSLLPYLKENIIDSGIDNNNDIHLPRDISQYHLLKDELHFKNSSGLNISDCLVIELQDEARIEPTKLVNKYIYQVTHKYDDVSIVLTLINFEVTVLNNPRITKD